MTLASCMSWWTQPFSKHCRRSSWEWRSSNFPLPAFAFLDGMSSLPGSLLHSSQSLASSTSSRVGGTSSSSLIGRGSVHQMASWTTIFSWAHSSRKFSIHLMICSSSFSMIPGVNDFSGIALTSHRPSSCSDAIIHDKVVTKFRHVLYRPPPIQSVLVGIDANNSLNVTASCVKSIKWLLCGLCHVFEESTIFNRNGRLHNHDPFPETLSIISLFLPIAAVSAVLYGAAHIALLRTGSSLRAC